MVAWGGASREVRRKGRGGEQRVRFWCALLIASCLLGARDHEDRGGALASDADGPGKEDLPPPPGDRAVLGRDGALVRERRAKESVTFVLYTWEWHEKAHLEFHMEPRRERRERRMRELNANYTWEPSVVMRESSDI